MTCPLCNHPLAKPSWTGSAFYLGREYPYVQCLSCGSLYCAAMPDESTTARMYGCEYERSFANGESVQDPREPDRVIRWLRELGGGLFVDYGCGAGILLKEAVRLGWRAIGVELDARVAEAAQRRSGVKVVTCPEELPAGMQADVLHLGDVIEHLTDINHQLRGILRLIRPGGLLLAQGPLEANANLFTLVVRGARQLRRRRRIEMPPYHVLLATAAGQRRLFRRCALEELEFSMREVAWPAPGRLTFGDLRRPRAVGLRALRRVSQAISALAPNRLGNRYFYVGRRGSTSKNHDRRSRPRQRSNDLQNRLCATTGGGFLDGDASER